MKPAFSVIICSKPLSSVGKVCFIFGKCSESCHKLFFCIIQDRNLSVLIEELRKCNAHRRKQLLKCLNRGLIDALFQVADMPLRQAPCRSHKLSLHHRKHLSCPPSHHFHTPDPHSVYRCETAVTADILPYTPNHHISPKQCSLPIARKPHR